jgi:hypothetical protein
MYRSKDAAARDYSVTFSGGGSDLAVDVKKDLFFT